MTRDLRFLETTKEIYRKKERKREKKKKKAIRNEQNS
tara:strand:- start:295 stop:405 length:111 start_codon:yes stop_codon:yes gene_type:complete